jgi:hypothetical protein
VVAVAGCGCHVVVSRFLCWSSFCDRLPLSLVLPVLLCCCVLLLPCRVGPGNMCIVHVSLVPIIGVVGEQKTKPTQHSVAVLRSLGLHPNLLACRCSEPLEDSVRQKLVGQPARGMQEGRPGGSCDVFCSLVQLVGWCFAVCRPLSTIHESEWQVWLNRCMHTSQTDEGGLMREQWLLVLR